MAKNNYDSKSALQYFRNNSTLIKQVKEDYPVTLFDPKTGQSEDVYSVFEQRKSINGKTFVIHDHGRLGWDLYLNHGHDFNTTAAVNAFNLFVYGH